MERLLESLKKANRTISKRSMQSIEQLLEQNSHEGSDGEEMFRLIELIENLASTGKLPSNEELLKKMADGLEKCWHRIHKFEFFGLQSRLFERLFCCLIHLATYAEAKEYMCELFAEKILIWMTKTRLSDPFLKGWAIESLLSMIQASTSTKERMRKIFSNKIHLIVDQLKSAADYHMQEGLLELLFRLARASAQTTEEIKKSFSESQFKAFKELDQLKFAASQFVFLKSWNQEYQRIQSFPFHLIHVRNQGNVKSHSGITWIHFGYYIITFFIEKPSNEAGGGGLIELAYRDIEKISLSKKENRVRLQLKSVGSLLSLPFFGIEKNTPASNVSVDFICKVEDYDQVKKQLLAKQLTDEHASYASMPLPNSTTNEMSTHQNNQTNQHNHHQNENSTSTTATRASISPQGANNAQTTPEKHESQTTTTTTSTTTTGIANQDVRRKLLFDGKQQAQAEQIGMASIAPTNDKRSKRNAIENPQPTNSTNNHQDQHQQQQLQQQQNQQDLVEEPSKKKSKSASLILDIDEFRAFVGTIKTEISAIQQSSDKYEKAIQSIEGILGELKKNDFPKAMKDQIKRLELIVGEYSHV